MPHQGRKHDFLLLNALSSRNPAKQINAPVYRMGAPKMTHFREISTPKDGLPWKKLDRTNWEPIVTNNDHQEREISCLKGP